MSVNMQFNYFRSLDSEVSDDMYLHTYIMQDEDYQINFPITKGMSAELIDNDDGKYELYVYKHKDHNTIKLFYQHIFTEKITLDKLPILEDMDDIVKDFITSYSDVKTHETKKQKDKKILQSIEFAYQLLNKKPTEEDITYIIENDFTHLSFTDYQLLELLEIFPDTINKFGKISDDILSYLINRNNINTILNTYEYPISSEILVRLLINNSFMIVKDNIDKIPDETIIKLLRYKPNKIKVIRENTLNINIVSTLIEDNPNNVDFIFDLIKVIQNRYKNEAIHNLNISSKNKYKLVKKLEKENIDISYVIER